MSYIDLTHEIVDKLSHFPGDTDTKLKQIANVKEDKYNNFLLEMSLHTGTHVDTPKHYINEKDYISNYELDKFIGNGILIDGRGKDTIDFDNKLEKIDFENKIVLICTGYSKYFGSDKYYLEHPVLTDSLVEFFISKNIKAIGLDTPSPDKMPFELHKLLFSKDIFIIENLTNLEKLFNVKEFEVFATPLKVRADSSIARVIAKV